MRALIKRHAALLMIARGFISGSGYAWLRSAPVPKHRHYVFSAVRSGALPNHRRWDVLSLVSAAAYRRRAFDSPFGISTCYTYFIVV